ncbi:hypothetical protein YC2023_080234 [Brassica napus]
MTTHPLPRILYVNLTQLAGKEKSHFVCIYPKSGPLFSHTPLPIQKLISVSPMFTTQFHPPASAPPLYINTHKRREEE